MRSDDIAQSVATSQPLSLVSTVRRLGLIPVSADVLLAHQERMLRAHATEQPKRWEWAVPTLAIIGFIAGSVAAAYFAGSLLMFLLVIGAILPMLNASVRGPRVSVGWVEYRIPASSLARASIPASIRSVADALTREFPATSFVIGELRRKAVVLDPYLIAEYGSERVVLGIWDGEQIIAGAHWRG